MHRMRLRWKRTIYPIALPACTDNCIRIRSNTPMLAIAVDEVVAAANDLLGRRG